MSPKASLPAPRPAPTAVLLRLEAACRALAEARSLPEVKEVRDQAAAITRYLRQQRYGLEAQNQAAELKLRAERRLGELLAATVDHGGGKRAALSNGVLPEGVTRMQSSRWQQVAGIPPAAFERHLREVMQDGGELTTAGVLDLARALARERDRRKRKRAAGVFARTYRPGDDDGILTGDLDLLRGRLEDGSADLFLTDPPYAPEHLPLYGRLAELAAAKLRPGALCLAYAGKFFLPQVFEQLGRHLTYWWTFAVQLTGAPDAIWSRHIEARWRTVVAFCRPPVKPAPAMLSDLIFGGGREKGLHEWQQAESEAAYLIERLTEPGALVVDPFCGSGTVPAAARKLGRKWLATEIDPATAALARQRVLAAGRPCS
jgi:hypothetical protein